MPDAFGFLECASCGWGGPDDPLESAKGALRFFTGLDRRISLAQAQSDLARLAANRDRPLRLNPLYSLTLLIASTVIYLTILGIFVGSIALVVWSILDQAWGGLILGVILLALFGLAWWEGRFAPKAFARRAPAFQISLRR
jgi:hypothetical protein